MVQGVGGSSFAAELERMAPVTRDAQPIAVAECRSVEDAFGVG